MLTSATPKDEEKRVYSILEHGGDDDVMGIPNGVQGGKKRQRGAEATGSKGKEQKKGSGAAAAACHSEGNASGGEGSLKLLYVTPEKVAKSKRFMSKLEKCNAAGRLRLIAVDVRTWGAWCGEGEE